MKNYILKYSTIIAYIIVVTLVECFGALVVDGSFFIADPRYLISILFFTSSILFLIKNDKLRFGITCIFLLIFGVLNIALILMYEMTGQHFTYAMFNLRQDAMGIIENIPLNFFYTIFFFVIFSVFIVFGHKLILYIQEKKINLPISLLTKIIIGTTTITLSLTVSSLTAYQLNTNDDKYNEMLYGTANSNYAQYGITSNFVNELYKGTFYNQVEKIEDKEVFNFLYDEVSTKSDYFGISKDNNVITLLAETLEWYGFISNPELYPNGLTLSYNDLKNLFPNFYFFFEESIVLDNYYVKEKTDVSEMYTNLGSYPTDKFINYDYSESVLPQSIANTLETIYDVNYKNTFHNGTYTFYNRHNIHQNLGYNKYYASPQLEELENGFTDYLLDGERNLDTELFNSAKDIMIPTNERFYSYALSITMHGLFSFRNNLDNLGYYDKLAAVGYDIHDEDLTDEEYAFISYLATGLDFDAALGILKKDLEDKNLLDDTTIVVFSDHYAYYQGLSSYVKDIGTPQQSLENGDNYVEMYRVPVFIYDTKVTQAMKNNGDDRIISKFTTASDIVPTLFDILGIRYYSNMYYGTDVFSDKESISYSRSYNVFMDDKVYFKNLNRIDYYNSDFNTAQLNNYITTSVEPRALQLVEKIKYANQIFEYNLYSNETYYNEYIAKLKALQLL